MLFFFAQKHFFKKRNVILFRVKIVFVENGFFVRYHNSDKEVSTPTINELVKNGIELNRHYAYPFCSPSRSSLQSGKVFFFLCVYDMALKVFHSATRVFYPKAA
jgi:arylsulfatase A-like enzyme